MIARQTRSVKVFFCKNVLLNVFVMVVLTKMSQNIWFLEGCFKTELEYKTLKGGKKYNYSLLNQYNTVYFVSQIIVTNMDNLTNYTLYCGKYVLFCKRQLMLAYPALNGVFSCFIQLKQCDIVFRKA